MVMFINASYSLFSANGEGVPVSPSGRVAAAASLNPTEGKDYEGEPT